MVCLICDCVVEYSSLSPAEKKGDSFCICPACEAESVSNWYDEEPQEMEKD